MTYVIIFSIRNSISHIKKKYCAAAFLNFVLRKYFLQKNALRTQEWMTSKTLSHLYSD